MKINSQSLFGGAAILAVIFFATEAWPLLAVVLLVVFCGLVVADREQLAVIARDADTAAMFVDCHSQPLLSLDHFRGHELIGYRSGYPVYRTLAGRGAHWGLVGHEDEVDEMPRGAIRVFPGFIYRRLDD
ncbi:hypothetical protein QU481_12765 [Crenobacter sp. SG2303]|uniref:Uncharacterized protein n=1 Tax=Crenobacter oryzisoli TaxID=3056844 RepID=A0ABT7XPN4_9NEIS|nr:hypothetical protein [Crenobacter sp. SG2303]MDN0075757.1 hypothetical protein [Crenobacter sp. SG2303]